MINLVEKNLRERAVTSTDTSTEIALNREIIPTVREIRTRLNETIASVSFEIVPTVTSAYSATYSEFIKVDPSGGGFIVTLPAPTQALDGESVIIKNVSVSANAVEVVSEGGALVETATSHFISGALFAHKFICDYTENCWWQV